MEDNVPRIHAAGNGGEQFSSRDRIQPQPLTGHQGRHGQAAVGLGGVKHKRFAGVVARQGMAIGLATGPQGGFIQHIEGCAIVGRQISQATTTHPQLTLRINRSAQGRQVAVGTLGINILFVGAEAWRRHGSNEKFE